jgi:hypothetical protein
MAVHLSDQNHLFQVRESVRNLIRDPISKMLLANSQLTSTQLETLITDSLTSTVATPKSQKRMFRPSKAHISRGAYNRTLIQAQNNVIRSIFTILLLGYLELFDSASLQPFLELSDTINSYAQEAKSSGNARLVAEQLKPRLLAFASALAKRESFKDQLQD